MTLNILEVPPACSLLLHSDTVDHSERKARMLQELEGVVARERFPLRKRESALETS